MQPLMLGAIAMASLVASLFFFRFWRKTRDRFFLLFALAFAVDCLHRTVLGAVGDLGAEMEPLFYLVRLVVFGIILAAIVDKNTRRR